MDMAFPPLEDLGFETEPSVFQKIFWQDAE